MKCPICGGAELQHLTRDVDYEYKGRKTLVRNITGDFCGTCGEMILNEETSAAYMAAISAFNRAVNAEAVDPHFIARVRKRFKLDQRRAAEIFGGGANAFSRYETGRVAPPKPLILLFKALDKHPELFDELMQA